MLALTAAAGVVDAVSYLHFDHVFVANMTGNVVFLGFGAAGAPNVSASKSAIALVAFALGAMAGGRIAAAVAPGKARLLAAACAIEAVLVAVALGAVMAGLETGRTAPFDAAAIATLASAMGVQTIAARRLGVADMSTTVLTTTTAILAADLAGGDRSRLGIRLLTIAAMASGACAGAALVLRAGAVAALAVAVVLFVAVAAAAQLRLADLEREPGRAPTEKR